MYLTLMTLRHIYHLWLYNYIHMYMYMCTTVSNNSACILC